jgi:ABC-2 type transport system ATP-binding protein
MSIEVSNLTKYYGEQAAVNNITFEVKRGEIVGFLGPNGAGKSTTMKMITGYIPMTRGQIKVCGMEVTTDSLDTRRKIGYLPENNPLYLDMYVKEYLAFVGKLYKIKNVKDRVEEMIKAVGLEVEQNKKIGMLSKGYRQRVGLAQAIIHDPEVLILDEPTSGLDPNQLVEIRELIKKIGKEKTVMLSTHIMQEVEAICDRVVIIKKGEIVADGKTSELNDGDDFVTVYAEFDMELSRNQLAKIANVSRVQKADKGWLFEGSKSKDIRKDIAQFAQENKILVLTLKLEEKRLEEVFKMLTKEA